MLRDLLNAEGLVIGRQHVATLMKRMGNEAIYRKPNTSKPGARTQDLPVSPAQRAGHQAQPGLGDGPHLHPHGAGLCLSRGRRRLVQPPGLGSAVVDHYGSGVLHRGTGGSSGPPRQTGDLQSDQGSQFTGTSFTDVLLKAGIAISMDGKGSWRDNVFVERLWRSVKYEEVYLKAYDSVAEARSAIGGYFGFYNTRRPHSSLERRTPDQAYFNELPVRLAA